MPVGLHGARVGQNGSGDAWEERDGDAGNAMTSRNMKFQGAGNAKWRELEAGRRRLLAIGVDEELESVEVYRYAVHLDGRRFRHGYVEIHTQQGRVTRSASRAHVEGGGLLQRSEEKSVALAGSSRNRIESNRIDL